MNPKAPPKFDPATYLDQLKRCNIENEQHLIKALDLDLDVNEMRLLCQHLNCNASGLILELSYRLGLRKRPACTRRAVFFEKKIK